MKFKIDLHVHSKYSGDSDLEPEEAIHQAMKVGLHGIAFTEHYSYEASEPVERLRERYKNHIRIFRGVEFSAAEGHCLVFGANTDRMSVKYAPAKELVRIVHESGGVVIPSHPYRKINSIGDVVLDLNGIFAIEGYNGCNMHAFNAKAVETAGLLRIPFTGGSDAHGVDEVGSCFTEFEDEVTDENLIAMLRTGAYTGIDTRVISRWVW